VAFDVFRKCLHARFDSESPVSTGKPGFSTPPGHYRVVSKDRNHVSSEFGDYVDDYGNVVKSNIGAHKDSQPRGTHFDGARMPYCIDHLASFIVNPNYTSTRASSGSGEFCSHHVALSAKTKFHDHAFIGRLQGMRGD
jgi:hypothetical protein